MNDNSEDKDETEAVCGPMIRLVATVQTENGTEVNAATYGKLDQTEPCAFAPMIRVQATEDGERNSGNGKS